MSAPAAPRLAQPCPCGSGRLLSACCGPYLTGPLGAPTAEALMRSRYTAFVLRDAAYLLSTWDPAHRPAELDLRADPTEWLGLQIVGTEAGGEADQRGRVEFVARFRTRGTEQALHENSRFRRHGERWLYVDGEIERSDALDRGRGSGLTGPAGPGRNAPCPCGSGQKWKRCCGK